MKQAKPSATTRKQAVAIQYDAERQDAPTVVAKGRGQIAETIIAKAQEAGVPIHEDASLVEVLSRLDIDQAIPPELYQLVAELLSFIYRTDQRAGVKEKSQ